MPTDLPKVTAYISAETRAVLDEASEALGQSRSHLVGELLDSAVPVLRALIDAARVLREAGPKQRAAFAATAEDIAATTTEAANVQAAALELIGRLGAQQPTPVQ